MFMVLKKKQMLIATLVLMLAAAGYLNYRYDDKEDAKDVLSINDENEPDVGDTAMVNADAGKTDKKSDKEDIKDSGKGSEKTDYFASYRLDREKTRAQAKEELEKTVANKSMSEEARKDAEHKLNEMASAAANESQAESILKSKGFEDVVVFINNDVINVTVKSDGLSTADTAKIIDTVYELTKNNNIKIVEVE